MAAISVLWPQVTTHLLEMVTEVPHLASHEGTKLFEAPHFPTHKTSLSPGTSTVNGEPTVPKHMCTFPLPIWGSSSLPV